MPIQVEHSKVLIVDDEAANVRLLERILARAGYAHLFSTMDAREALPLFLEYQPDIVLLDLMMPYLDGFSVLQQLKEVMHDGLQRPVLVLTADATQEARHRALREGARDFLTKPLDQTEVVLRIRNVLQVYHLQRLLQDQNALLEQRVQERTQALEEAQMEVLERLAQAAEYRDDDTGEHTRRVGECAAKIAQELQLPSVEVDLLRRAAPLHDVGKIGISDLILLKPDKLTDEEFATMKTHTIIGGNILANGRSELMKLAHSIALTHHERPDGRGYPQGLKQDDIPTSGSIVAVADVFDALTHDRPYKKAWPRQEAIDLICNGGGTQFCPHVVKAFLQLNERNLL